MPRPSTDHPSVNVPIGEVLALLQFLREEQGYDYLADVTAIDWSAYASKRFTVVWHLYSSTKHGFVRVAADCLDNADPVAPSAIKLWAGANWHERECFDLLGVKFEGHPDLRRILMWEGYPYYPLRKEFPLAGLPAELPDPEISAETKSGLVSAPMDGGPFVSKAGKPMSEAEPRAKDEAWSEGCEKPKND